MQQKVSIIQKTIQKETILMDWLFEFFRIFILNVSIATEVKIHKNVLKYWLEITINIITKLILWFKWHVKAN